MFYGILENSEIAPCFQRKKKTKDVPATEPSIVASPVFHSERPGRSYPTCIETAAEQETNFNKTYT